MPFALFLMSIVMTSACAAQPTTDHTRTVALIDASFGHCGPDWRCDGPRLAQYLGTLATLGGDVLVPYGKPGDHSDDFLRLAQEIAKTKRDEFSENEPLDAAIIGMTGEGIADAINGTNTTIRNGVRTVEVLMPIATRVIALYYVDIEPYNDYARRVGWPVADLDAWDSWRERYCAAMEAAGAEVVEVHGDWTPVLPGWHIDSASSYRAALRLWDIVLSD